MKPASFRYYRAASLPEAVSLLSGPAANGKLLAGGQSLVPLLNLRLARPEAVVDLNYIPGLSYIRTEGKEIAIGALTRHREVEFSELIARELPALREAMPLIGHPAIRNRGTVGGSVAHADPAAELPCVLTALDARFVAVGPTGERTIAAADFFLGFYETVLSEREILKEIRIPLVPRARGWSFVEFARRHGDFALGEASVLLYETVSGGGVGAARVVVGGVGLDKPLRLGPVEALVQNELGAGLRETSAAAVLARAEEAGAAEVRAHAAGGESADYRIHLAGVLARRALEAALCRWHAS